MIKNMLYICLLALAFAACEQKDSFLYEDKAGLYFYVPAPKEGETEDPNALVKEINFAFRATGQRHPMFSYPIYYGDSLRTDTLRLIVSLVGKASNQPREYYLKSIIADEELPMTELEFQNPYILKANALLDTAIVIIPRPIARGEYAVGITFEESADFEEGISGKKEYKLFISDRYPKPEDWEDYIYGEYSEEKYAFWVTVLKTTYDYRSWIMDENWMPTNGLTYLIPALKEYNSTHPDTPKDFTFPGMD